MNRQDIVSAARRWIGTPYLHRASCRGAGADCLGLIRGLYRELYGREPEHPPPYTPDWNEINAPCRESLTEAARRHLLEIDPQAAQQGDVMIFRMQPDMPAKHAAILAAPGSPGSPGRMIHAYQGRGVCEGFMGRWWRVRLAYGFSFPGID